MPPITLEDLTDQLEALRDVVQSPESAADALSSDEREEYRKKQQSVVDARRGAEATEGLLQVN